MNLPAGRKVNKDLMTVAKKYPPGHSTGGCEKKGWPAELFEGEEQLARPGFPEGSRTTPKT